MHVAWWIGLSGAATVVLIAIDRLTRRLLPLAALLKLALVFPDEAPSRFRTALDSGTTADLEQRLQRARDGAESDTPVEAAERLLGFVAALSAHDRITRGHSERVRAYSQMIAKELHLSRDEVDRLNWAALLHDVGKLEVPAEILNKEGRPSDEEWQFIRSHPELGARLGAAAAAVARRVDRRDLGPPRALGRQGLPEGQRGRRHLARRPHRGRRRRVRRHHLGALVQGAGRRGRRARRDRALLGRAVRSARRARVPGCLARPPAARDGAAVVARAGTRARPHPAHARHRDGCELGRRHHRLGRGRTRRRAAGARVARVAGAGCGCRAGGARRTERAADAASRSVAPWRSGPRAHARRTGRRFARPGSRAGLHARRPARPCAGRGGAVRSGPRRRSAGGVESAGRAGAEIGAVRRLAAGGAARRRSAAAAATRRRS